ncbi:MAG: ATP-binding cassette domain-containing protein [Verrucomicrobiales bacterium]|nr:ATP-binding cassette domain-containing protein [Verrucomicrobiales bacterium]
MLSCRQLSRDYRGPQGPVRVLRELSFEAARGDMVVIRGPSGAGKTTLLLTLGGMLRPNSGSVMLDGQDLYSLSAADRARLRNRRIGFVFQLFHLVPYLSVHENILAGLPGSVDGTLRRRASGLLEELGLASRENHRPAALSAGERQRTALARALLKEPSVMLADEPAGNLDPANGAVVFQHLEDYRRKGGTVIVVTHGTESIPATARRLRLENGVLLEESVSAQRP